MALLAAFVRAVDAVNERVGRAVSWLTLAMVAIVFAGVVLRYGFGLGWIAMQESYVWLHGAVFMLGAGYTLLHEGHVRVDVIYRGAGPRFKAWVDLIGVAALLLPMIVTVALVSGSYIADSWTRLEASGKAGGLPGVFALKSVILLFCVLVGLQGLALAGRSLLRLLNAPLPQAEDEEAEDGEAEDGEAEDGEAAARRERP